jgi:hypothetical protein
VTVRIGIPLRQHDHRSSGFLVTGLGWKEASTSDVVLRGLSLYRACPGESIINELEVVNRWQGVERVAVVQDSFGVTPEHLPGVIAVDMIDNEPESPVEWAHKPIIVALIKSALAAVHVCFPKTHETSRISQSRNPKGQG